MRSNQNPLQNIFMKHHNKTGGNFANISYREFQFSRNLSKTTVPFHRNGVCLRTASDGLKLILKMTNCGHGERWTINYETASTNLGTYCHSEITFINMISDTQRVRILAARGGHIFASLNKNTPSK